VKGFFFGKYVMSDGVAAAMSPPPDAATAFSSPGAFHTRQAQLQAR
jgi:hypothetical protein